MTDASPSQAARPASSGTAGTAGFPAGMVVMPGLSPDATTWLEARGLDVEVASQLGLVSVKGRGPDEWLAFPFVEGGRVVNHKYRCLTSKRFQQDKGGKQVFWNHDALTDKTLRDQPVIITEGECDALVAIQCGFPRTVSVPGGAPDRPVETDGKFRYLADALPLLSDCKQIIICTDGDEPGRILLDELGKRLGRGRCRYVEMPAGCKDLNDVLIGYGDRAVVEAINGAKWLHFPGIYLPSELPPLPRTRQHVSGMPGLDERYRVRRGDFCVLTGIPGSGKTTWMNDLAFRMAENHGWRTCFASFEQPPQTEHMRNLRRLFAGRPEHEMSGDKVREADAWIERHFSFVVPHEDQDSTLDEVLEMLATSIVRHEADMCVIDPWNELDHARDKFQSLTEYVGDSIRRLKRFAKKFSVHLVVVAHPQKPAGSRDGAIPEPSLYSISDSAHWYNKADVGVVLHPKRSDLGHHFTQVRIAKSKYHDQIGFPGVVPMTLNTVTGRYSETSP